ncbi:lymphocyte antigen 6 complex locus protein G5c isoform X1 [Fukomys damarensis]|uniref:lymphocyte antigen 6 complex locus protein G5c isoform X1 n=1 Tax=Fukomys damarensis TaxID=885580 RepID=UPI001455B9BB|nr:lymphocyte antigen 6 complex locus protein G5c isoform X1 [Fukomys damarensis]
MLLLVLATASVVLEPPQPPPLPKYLRCYRCLFETKELGCLLGSDICLVPAGSSCITLHIRNASPEGFTCFLDVHQYPQTAFFRLVMSGQHGRCPHAQLPTGFNVLTVDHVLSFLTCCSTQSCPFTLARRMLCKHSASSFTSVRPDIGMFDTTDILFPSQPVNSFLPCRPAAQRSVARAPELISIPQPMGTYVLIFHSLKLGSSEGPVYGFLEHAHKDLPHQQSMMAASFWQATPI